MEVLTPDFNEPIDHDLPFDPTHGYDLEALLQVEAPMAPDDFAEFWQATYEQTRNTPLDLTQRPSPLGNDQVEVFEVEFDSLHKVRIGGWVVLPRAEKIERGAVVGHGYGGRSKPVLSTAPATAAIYPCARGFHRSGQPNIPNTAARHVLHGIEARETYVHRGCAADVWAAASALSEMVPEIEGQMFYKGASFGGGIGALAVPWEPRFRCAFLDIPSFGPHPLRVTLPCTGSGEAVRKYYQRHPEVLDVLQYFDSTIAAQHIQIPTIIAAAQFDPGVPPPGQFAVFNALPSQKELLVRQMAHFIHPLKYREGAMITQRVTAWLKEKM